MKQKYEIYDFGLNERQNFFLTKATQRYRFFRQRDREAFAYISVNDSRQILGQYHLKEKIKELEDKGYIETNPLRTSRFGYEMTAYRPLITDYRRCESSSYFIHKYYLSKSNELSIYGKEIVRRLKNTQILVPGWSQVHQEAFQAYQAKGGTKGYLDYLSDIRWIQEEVSYFNKATHFIDYVSEDKFGNRVHSFISNLPRAMRKHVLLSGSPVVEVDLAQSQPLIMAKTLMNEIEDNTFSQAVHNQDIYLLIKDYLNLSTREMAKTILYRMIFGPAYSGMAKEFYRIFPDVKDYLVELKTKKMIGNPSPKIHSNLACKMQRTETAIFRVIWSKLMANRIPYISIHDGLLVKKEDSERVKKYMEEILIRYLGTSVIVNIK